MNAKSAIIALSIITAYAAAPSQAATSFVYRHVNSTVNSSNAANQLQLSLPPLPLMTAGELWEIHPIVSNHNDKSVTYSISPEDPTKIAVDPGTGHIMAFAQESGDFGTYTLTAMTEAGSASTSFSLYAYGALTLDPVEEVRLLEGQPLEQPLIVSGGKAPYQFSIVDENDLNGQISINATSGLITGTPEHGRYDFTVRVIDDNGKTADQPINVAVDEARYWQANVNITNPNAFTSQPLVENAILMSGKAGQGYIAVLDGKGQLYSYTTLSAALPLSTKSGRLTYLAGQQFLVGVDEMGNVVSNRSIRHATYGNMNITAISANGSGEIALLGTFQIGGSARLSLVKIRNSSVQWAKYWSSGLPDGSVAVGASGEVYAFYKLATQTLISKFDASGSTDYSVSPSANLSTPTSTAVDQDGRLVIVDGNAKATKLASDGSVMWAYQYPFSHSSLSKNLDGTLSIVFDGKIAADLSGSGSLSNAHQLGSSNSIVYGHFKTVHGEQIIANVADSSKNEVIKLPAGAKDTPNFQWSSIAITGASPSGITTSAQSPAINQLTASFTLPGSTLSYNGASGPAVTITPIEP